MAGEWASPEEVAVHEARAARNEARLARVCAAADYMVLRGIARNLTAILPVYVRGDYTEDDFDETELSFLELCARLSGKIAASRQAIEQGLLFPLGEPAPRACLFSPAELRALEAAAAADVARAAAWAEGNRRLYEEQAARARRAIERRNDAWNLLRRGGKVCVYGHDVDHAAEVSRLCADDVHFASMSAQVFAAELRWASESGAQREAGKKAERAATAARGKRALPDGYAVEKQGSRWMVVDPSGRRMRVDGTTKGDAVDRAHALADERAQAEKDATRH